MAWVKQTKGGNFLRFEEGAVHEGIFKGATEKPSPFKPGEMMWDYLLEINGVVKTLSSTSEALKTVLPNTPIGTKVRVEMKLFKGRKVYDVYFASAE